MDREAFYRLVLRGLAIAFALVGMTFVLRPDGVVRDLEAFGAWLGSFEPAPSSELRFWVSLSFAYMVLVTILAWIAQRDLRRYRHLLPILAAGKAASSLTCLVYYWFSIAAFPYLANFLVDGSITLIVLKIWADIPGLGDPAGGAARAEATAGAKRRPGIDTRTALLEALIPAGGAFAEGASTVAVAEEIEAFVARAGRARAFRAGLRLLEVSPFLLPPIRLRRFSRLSLEDRIRLLEAWESSRLWPRRAVVHLFKLVAATHFYARPEIHARLGYPHPLERVPLSGSAAPPSGAG